MTKLKFEPSDVRRLVAHTLAAKNHMREYGDKRKPRPQLILVHDEGIYLMSNGIPRDMLNGDEDRVGTRSFVAYAEGFDPYKLDRGKVWDDARAAVGGDDFANHLDLRPMMVKDIQEGRLKSFTVELSERGYWIEATFK